MQIGIYKVPSSEFTELRSLVSSFAGEFKQWVLLWKLQVAMVTERW